MKLIIAKDEVASWKICNRFRTKRAGTKKKAGRIGRQQKWAPERRLGERTGKSPINRYN